MPIGHYGPIAGPGGPIAGGGIVAAAAGTTYTLSLAAGSFTLTGIAVGLTAQRKLVLEPGAFTLGGNPVALLYSSLSDIVPSTGGGRSSSEPWRVTWKRRKKFDDAIEATLLEAFAPAGKVALVKEEVRWIKPDAGEFLKKLKGRPFVEEDEEEDLLLLM